MQVFTGIAAVPRDYGPSVVTIGNFDGVHLGHQQVVGSVVRIARERGLSSVAMTFDPHPAAVHRPENRPEPICSLADRLSYLERTGLDATLVVPYSLDFARQTPEGFVLTYLVGLLGMKVIVAGRDIRFGWENAGTIDTLRALGDEYGFEVVTIEDIGGPEHHDGRWSSTLVRQAMADGDVASATTMLGRAPIVRGTVVHGDKRGRELGFPTANLGGVVSGLIPADGVYAGWLVDEADGRRLPAAISVGTNPTFGANSRRVEAYVLDRDDLDLYDAEVSVEFVAWVRGQVEFSSLDSLVEAMGADVAQVRQILVD